MPRYSNRRLPYYGSGYYGPGVVAPCFATVCCSFLGFGFCFMGLIMTVVAYYGHQFTDDPTKILGPMFLCFGVVAVCIAIGLGCYTVRKKRALESQTAQNQSTQSSSEPPVYSAFSAPNNPGPDVYDPERRGLTANMPSSYSTSFGQPPVSQLPYPIHEPTKDVSGEEKLSTGVSPPPPYPLQQPSFNPDFAQLSSK